MSSVREIINNLLEGFDYKGRHYHKYRDYCYCDDEIIDDYEYSIIYNEYLKDKSRKDKETDKRYEDEWNNHIWVQATKNADSCTYGKLIKSIDEPVKCYAILKGNNYMSRRGVATNYNNIVLYIDKEKAKLDSSYRGEGYTVKNVMVNKNGIHII